MDWFNWQGDTLVLRLRVQPRARQPGVGTIQGDRLRIRIAAPPIDDKANEALLTLLARDFELPRRALTITHGAHGQLKTVTLVAPLHLPEWFRELSSVPCSSQGQNLDSQPPSSACP